MNKLNLILKGALVNLNTEISVQKFLFLDLILNKQPFKYFLIKIKNHIFVNLRINS